MMLIWGMVVMIIIMMIAVVAVLVVVAGLVVVVVAVLEIVWWQKNVKLFVGRKEFSGFTTFSVINHLKLKIFTDLNTLCQRQWEPMLYAVRHGELCVLNCALYTQPRSHLGLCPCLQSCRELSRRSPRRRASWRWRGRATCGRTSWCSASTRKCLPRS